MGTKAAQSLSYLHFLWLLLLLLVLVVLVVVRGRRDKGNNVVQPKMGVFSKGVSRGRRNEGGRGDGGGGGGGREEEGEEDPDVAVPIGADVTKNRKSAMLRKAPCGDFQVM